MSDSKCINACCVVFVEKDYSNGGNDVYGIYVCLRFIYALSGQMNIKNN